MNQKDLIQGRENQMIEMQELNKKFASMTLSKEKLENQTHKMQEELKDLTNKE